MVDENVQEKVQTAVALQALTSEIGFVKGQLTEMSSNMKGFATKVELEDFKKEVEKNRQEDLKDHNETIKNIHLGFEKHNIDDKESFGSLVEGQKEAAKEAKKNNETLIRVVTILSTILTIVSLASPFIVKLVFKI